MVCSLAGHSTGRDPTQTIRGKKTEQEASATQQVISAPPAPPAPPRPGSQAALVSIPDHQVRTPAVLVAKRQRTDSAEPTGTEHMRPTKKMRYAENEDAMIDPRLRNLVEHAG